MRAHFDMFIFSETSYFWTPGHYWHLQALAQSWTLLITFGTFSRFLKENSFFFVSRYHLYFFVTSLYRGRELEMILSPRASIEGTKSKAYIGGGSESLYLKNMKEKRNIKKYEGISTVWRRRRLTISPSLRTYIQELRIFLCPRGIWKNMKEYEKIWKYGLSL